MKRNIIKNSVLELDSYKPEPQQAEIVLNANENPYNLPGDLREKIATEIEKINFNRYPDPFSTELREVISEKKDIPVDQILVGNGLDEVLSIITNTFIEPGDTVITHSPGFSMYKIWTDIAGGDVIEVEDTEDHKINIHKIVDQAIRNNAKIIYICSPNNPTGYKINLRDLEELLESTPSLIILDEAYVDFSDESFIEQVKNYDNLMVLRTMSKYFRVPGIRCGYVVGSKDLIDELYKVKAPYNLNSVTQKIAQIVLENEEDLAPAREEIINQRDKIYEFLGQLPNIKVFPSEGNFIYFKTPKHKELQDKLLGDSILLRYYPQDEAFRFTVGTAKENKKVMEVIEEVVNAD